jgi:hypothetical protein
MNRWREPAPGERESGERSWPVVRAAFDEREPVVPRRDWRPVAVVAIAAAVVAAALSPPGLAVLDSLRDAVRGEENAKPALFSLPATGRLLVNSAEGVWVVEHDGSKRLLAGYRDASWSPHGLYVAALHGHELRAIEPNGDKHWSIARPDMTFPRWSKAGGGDERVAYISRGYLRVVGGDGKGDRALADAVAPVAPAWKPATHILAFFDTRGRVRAMEVDSHRLLWTADVFANRPVLLTWSDDGRRLVAATESELATFDAAGKPLTMTGLGGRPVAAAFAPRSHRFALLRRFNLDRRSGVEVIHSDQLNRRRRLFAGAGEFGGLAWSPNGRWIILDWDSADQWLLIRSAAVRRVVAISNIARNFGPHASLAGWCCP